MNKVILIGRIASEVETRRTAAGKAVSSYRIAVDRRFKKEGQPDADFLSCVAFGNNGEFAEKYLNKGMKIAIEGSIQTRSYEGKDSKKVYVTEIIVDNHEFCEKKTESSGNSYGGTNVGYNASAYPTTPASDFAMIEDDDAQLPF